MTTAEARLPIALRLPRKEVEAIDCYAKRNNTTRTEAFLHYLRRGMEGEGDERLEQKLDNIEALLEEVLEHMTANAETEEVDGVAVREAVALESTAFPAIREAILFGSFARGDAGPSSDIDVRLLLDRCKQFSLYDLARFQKAVAQKTGREVDVITADVIKDKNLEAAIQREGVTVYERS